MTPDVDPRFDPRFQRGFDAAIHRVPKTQRPTPAAEPIIHPPPRDEPADALGASDSAHAMDSSSGGSPGEIDERVRGRNPFHLSLLLASLASIAGSVIVFWFWLASARNGFSYNSFTPSWEFFWAQFGGSIPGPLLSAGLIGLVGWVALGAFLGRSRDRE